MTETVIAQEPVCLSEDTRLAPGLDSRGLSDGCGVDAIAVVNRSSSPQLGALTSMGPGQVWPILQPKAQPLHTPRWLGDRYSSAALQSARPAPRQGRVRGANGVGKTEASGQLQKIEVSSGQTQPQALRRPQQPLGESNARPSTSGASELQVSEEDVSRDFGTTLRGLAAEYSPVPNGRNDEGGNRFAQRIAVGDASMLQVRGEKTLPFETDLKLDDQYKTRYELSFRRALMRSPQQEFSVSFGFAYRDEEKPAPPGGLPPLGASPVPGQAPPVAAEATARPVRPSPPAPGAAVRSAAGATQATPPQPRLLSDLAAAPSGPEDSGATTSTSAVPPLPLVGAEGERTTVLQFNQDYRRRDRRGAWQLASRLNFGTGLLDATATSNDIADGQFFSWNGEVRRSQVLSPNHRLSLKLSTQLSPDSLMGSEQFKIGNGPKIEGLRIRDDRGDNGVRFSLEDRLTLARHRSGSPLFELMPLVDVGYVWNQVGGNSPPDRATEAFSVFGGLGMSWSPMQDTNLGLTLRVPLIYANDIDETAADKESTLKFSYRMQW